MGSAAQPERPALRGVLPVFQTPYHDDESIDYAILEKEIDWLFDAGADGIVMAMVSEVLRLSTDERELLAEHACRLGSGLGAVIISVGAESTRVAVRLGQHAESVGATAVMAIPPVSIVAMESEVLRYYDRILEAVDIPVVVQDASGYVGRPMPVDLLVRMQREFGSRVLFKPEATPIGPRLSALREATGGEAAVFEGSGGIALVDSYRRGIVGTMPGGELIEALVALWGALVAGDEQRTYRLSLPLSSLIGMQSGLDGFLAVEKYLLVKQGVFRNTLVRGPVGFMLDEETRAEVDRLFDQLMAAVRDV
ncbi:MAG: dihydrodipicolinate synthase family protein [Phycisphaerae bacterium]|nr:dihydrodipicolinate synthase family protein [Phycisphaerae bacterium]